MSTLNLSLVRFTPEAEMRDDQAWHISHNPTGTDTTLCGLALEGMGNARYGVKINDIKHGSFRSVTCDHCRRIVQFCKTV
jgi:hypothetical protein